MKSQDFVVDTYRKIAQKYTSLYFDISSDSYQVDKFLSYLPKSAQILDVGSGPGNFTQYIADQGYRVEGIDISPEMLKIAKRKAPKVTFSSMDMRRLDFPNESFDGLISAYSLIHIHSKEVPDVLSEFNRVLKSEGLLFIIVQERESDQIVDEPLMEGEKIFMNFFKKVLLKQMLESNGFKVLEIDTQQVVDEATLSDQILYAIARKVKKK